jgi:O-antigen/teichoic acid export membrane protein
MKHRIVKKLEGLMRTDVHYLLRGGSRMMLGQVGVSVIGLLSSIAFANLLSKDAYGTYQYLLGVTELLLTFTLTGIGQALVTATARGYDGTLTHAWKQTVLWSVPAMVLGCGAGIYYYIQGNTIFAFALALGTIANTLITASKHSLSFLNGKKLFGYTSSATVLGLLIPNALLIVTLLFWTTHLGTLILIYFVSNVIVSSILFVWTRRFAQNDKVDPTLTAHALHFSLQGLIGKVAAYLDRILLFQFAGPAALAEFWIAMNIQRNFSHIFKSANGIVLPKLSVRSFHELQQGLPRKIALLYAGIVPFTIVFVCIIPFLIHTFFPQYDSTIRYTQVLGILFLFLPVKILSDAFVSHGMHRTLYQTTTISAIVKLAGTLTLVPLFGIWGVIYALLIEQTLYSALVVWFFIRHKDHTRAPSVS